MPHLIPGRSAAVRGPTKKERRATSVLKMPIDEASAKIREGGPLDEDDDTPAYAKRYAWRAS